MGTKTFIYNFVENVLSDFKNSSWCDLNEFKLNSQSYEIAVNQKMYLLKYFAAYFCEYYWAYEDFFEKFNGNKLNIISIGCGSGIDFYTLDRVIADKNLSIPLNYRGIDIIDWDYKPQSATFKFQQKGIANLSSIDVEDVNLVVFPKSLTELDTACLKDFANFFAKECKSQNVFFLNSYIKNDPKSGYVDGINQFQTIAQTLLHSGFKTIDDITQYIYCKNANDWLGRAFNFFQIPDEVREITSTLKSICENYDVNQTGCKKCDINFIPIFRSNYIAYKVIEFYR